MYNKILSYFRPFIMILLIIVLILTSACIKIVTETTTSTTMPATQTSSTSILTSTTTLATTTFIPNNTTNSGIRDIVFTSSGNLYVMQADGSDRTLIHNYDTSCSDPNLTLDGSRIVFVQNGDLFTMNIDGSKKVKVTNHGSACHNPVWSHDGSHIAFYLDTQPYVINADGSNEHPIAAGIPLPPFQPELIWSPDSSFIAFESFWNNNGVAYSDICVANSNGIGYKMVSPHNGEYRSPSWSPDGSIIVFLDGKNGGIYSVYPDGSNLKTITVGESLDLPPNFVWSPDGSLICCIGKNSNTNGNFNNIIVFNLSGTYDKQITKFVDNMPSDSGYSYAGWSPDGNKIIGLLYHREDGSTDVSLMDTDGSNLIQLCNVICDYIFIIH